MSEFVKNDIFSVRGISCAGFSGVPSENDCSQFATGFAQTSSRAFFPNGTFNVPLFFDHVCRRIDKNREQMREIISLAAQQKQTSLRRDRHPNLVAEFEAAATLEKFFGQKYLNTAKQLGLV